MFCFYCRRAIIKSFDTDRPCAAPVEKHLRACPACSAFYEQHAAVAAQLRNEFASDTYELPPHLRDRIMTACGEGTDCPPLESASGDGRGIVNIVSVTAAAAALVIGLFAWTSLGPENERTEPKPVAGQKDGGSLVVAWLVTRGSVSPDKAVGTTAQVIEDPAASLDSLAADGMALVDSLEEYENSRK